MSRQRSRRSKSDEKRGPGGRSEEKQRAEPEPVEPLPALEPPAVPTIELEPDPAKYPLGLVPTALPRKRMGGRVSTRRR
ncbi:MAG: hypothetical protein ACYTGC_01270 [Planctomycetota bacterium]